MPFWFTPRAQFLVQRVESGRCPVRAVRRVEGAGLATAMAMAHGYGMGKIAYVALDFDDEK